MKVVDIPIGKEGDAQVNLSGGVLSIDVSENTAGLQGGLSVKIPLSYFIDAAVKKLGGSANEVAIAALIKSVLLGLG